MFMGEKYKQNAIFLYRKNVFNKNNYPPVNIFYGGRHISWTDSFVHLGIHYSFNLKNKDRISQRLHKTKHALFFISAKVVHAWGINPLVSVYLYSKVIVPKELYSSELWNNLTKADIAAISCFNTQQLNNSKVYLSQHVLIWRSPWSD